MDRIIGANTIDLGGGRRGFRGKDTVAGIAGTELTAVWHNAVQEEIVGLIERLGLAPDNADLAQLTRGVRSQKLNFVTAANVGGTANAILLTVDPPIASLADLVGVPLRFRTEAANTGPVTIAVGALAALPLVTADGSALSAGMLPLSSLVEVVSPDGITIRLMTAAQASVDAHGIARTATVAEAVAGIDAEKYVTPAGLAAATQAMPYFFTARAAANTTLVAGVWTKINLATEVVDTADCYNPATSRFTPTRAGYYLLTASLAFESATDNPTTGVRVYLNGVVENAGLPTTVYGSQHGSVAGGSVSAGADIIYFDGVDDFAEMYGYISATAANKIGKVGRLTGLYIGATV